MDGSYSTSSGAESLIFIAAIINYLKEQRLRRLPKALVSMRQINSRIISEDVHRPPPARLETRPALPPHFNPSITHNLQIRVKHGAKLDNGVITRNHLPFINVDNLTALLIQVISGLGGRRPKLQLTRFSQYRQVAIGLDHDGHPKPSGRRGMPRNDKAGDEGNRRADEQTGRRTTKCVRTGKSAFAL
jgi:hypothetical protein